MMKMATVYQRSNGWYLRANSETTMGVWIAAPPYLRLDMSVTSEELGTAVFSALEGSQEGVRHPDQHEWGKIFPPLYTLAKVKSWAAFAKNAGCVTIMADANYLTLEPWKNAGTKTGFVGIPDVRLELPLTAAPVEIGEAVRKLMTVSLLS